MLSKKMTEALNAQINAELWSAYLYLSMSNWCIESGYEGIANWLRIQAQEEQDHAEILSRHILERDGKVTLQRIDHVPNEWDSPIEVFEQVLKHEREVTMMINELMKQAIHESDFATESRLQWFVDEQVEEEDSALQILTELRRIGACECGCGIHLIDRELMQRTYHKAGPLS